MVPRNTKFSPDLLFFHIAKSYYKSDVFNETELQLIMEQFSHVVIDNGGIVRTWREIVVEKYSSLPGIRNLHDFIAVAVPPNKIVMKVRAKCYSGPLHDSPTRVEKDFVGRDSCIPRVTNSYKARGNLRTPTDSKLVNLEQILANFIAEEKWPDFVKSLGSSTMEKHLWCTVHLHVYLSQNA